MIKGFLSAFILLLWTINSFSTTYYLSNSGNDLNSGTSPAESWQTIAHLNTIVLLPGDSVLFESGSIFRGEIVVMNSGTGDSIIYFGKYGIGDLPVISGAEIVSGWSLYSGNTYEASFTQTPAYLFADGVRMTSARYPNSGLLIHQDGIGNNGFIDTSLTQPNDYWNGANVRMRSSDRLWESNSVESFSNDSILFQTPGINAMLKDYGYYFDNLFSLIDSSNEWYYDSASQQLYFIAPGNVNPVNYTVEASVYENGISFQNSSGNVTIDGILFRNQKGSAIYSSTSFSNLKVANCVFQSQGEAGIRLLGGSSNCSLTNNSFLDISGVGISLNSAINADISSNAFRRIGIIPGYGLSNYPNNMVAIDCGSSDSVKIISNKIDSVGSEGIFCGMTNSQISENILNHCLLFTATLGSIYIYGFQSHDCVLNDNFVYNTVGNIDATPVHDLEASGILGDSITNNLIGHNTITYGTKGISLSGGCSNNSIQHNLVYGCTTSQLSMSEGIIFGSSSNNTVTANTFYSLNESAGIVSLFSSYSGFQPAVFDSNYYFNPYAYSAFKTVFGNHGLEFPRYYTLSQWQQEIAMDQNSRSTFFSRQHYLATDTIGEDLISNSFFTNNFDGWFSDGAEDTIEMLLDNSTPLDFGCLKLAFLYSLPDSVYGISTTGFKMDSGSVYEFHLSNYSVRDGNIVLKSKEYDDSGGGFISYPRAFPFDESRHDYPSFIVPTNSCANCQLTFELSGFDSIVWLDNLTLFEVNAVAETPERKSRIFLNATGSTASIDLADSLFFNLDGQEVVNSILIPPYSSTVLVFDSALITSSQELSPADEFKIFPNPVMRGEVVNIHSNLHEYPYEICLYDLEGKFIERVYSGNANVAFKIPLATAQGIYIVQIKRENDTLIKKLVVH